MERRVEEKNIESQVKPENKVEEEQVENKEEEKVEVDKKEEICTTSDNKEFLKELEIYCKSQIEVLSLKDPQFNLNGPDHLWILKPAQLSRGRGIEVHDSYTSIINTKLENKNTPWIVQKYLENSLLINKRKFDIRQWVTSL